MRSWLHPGNEPLGSVRRGARIVVRDDTGESDFCLDLDGSKGAILVYRDGGPAGAGGATGLRDAQKRLGLCRRLFAALECAMCDPARPVSELVLHGADLLALAPDLAGMGLLREAADPVLRDRDVLAHRPGWMGSGARPPLGEAHSPSSGLPSRPPMPSGPLYTRHIPWLGQTLSFVAATMGDLPHLHRWLNDPLVDQFWREAGSIEQHQAYLQRQFDDPHTIPIIGELDGVPFGYFEVYWAAESVIGPYYAADPFDRGWHVLIGEPDYRGRPFISAWLPSLMHFIFLDEPRTKRIVGEPDAAHARQLRNLKRSGFDHFATVDLPTKRAALVALSRERFDRERLWLPASIHHENVARS